jgi:trehalose 6-phosphate phosphatase
MSPSRLMLGVDFDGTLAPIVPQPDAAVPDPEAVPLLSELSRALLCLAIVSGRDTDFLARRLPIDRLILVGNHGLEERRGDRTDVVPQALPYVDALQRASKALRTHKEVRVPGVLIEVKRVSVSVHFRQAGDPLQAAARLRPILETIATREKLQLQEGRLVLELRPPVEIDKGQVLRRLAAEFDPASIVYAGDDRTDVDAFRALKAIATSPVRTLAVGIQSRELPAETFSDCDLVLDGVAGTLELLRGLSTLPANA